MNLTITKISFMHGSCSDSDCPLCGDPHSNSSIKEVDSWLRQYLTILETGCPDSPWWLVEESKGDCYRTLRGDERHPGYYDKNPDIHY